MQDLGMPVCVVNDSSGTWLHELALLCVITAISVGNKCHLCDVSGMSNERWQQALLALSVSVIGDASDKQHEPYCPSRAEQRTAAASIIQCEHSEENVAAKLLCCI